MRLSMIFCCACCLVWGFIFAQKPVLTIDFESLPDGRWVNGIAGKALDLGPLAIDRRSLTCDNPLSNAVDITLMVWVNAFPAGQQAYDIVSSSDSVGNEWKIGVQPSGTWQFEAKADGYSYDYSPTAFRQPIRDGNWHLLGFSYNRSREELTFYYDGEKVAIYYAPGIGNFWKTAPLLIGGDSRGMGTADFASAWHSFYGYIDDIAVFDGEVDEQYIRGCYTRRTGAGKTSPPLSTPMLKVTALNIWKGGNQFGREAGKHRIIQSLQRLNADVYLLVETYGSGPEIADALGCQLYLISRNLAILSRYPIAETFRVYKAFHSGGVQIGLPDGKRIAVFCNWLSSAPQYFIKGLTAEESWPLDKFLEEDRKTRGRDMDAILSDIAAHIHLSDSIPLIVGGDFNSGSHLDWTSETASRHNGYVVPWPVSTAMQKAGFKDSFREIYPDPLGEPGLTWSPIREFPLKDRIDYIYYQGKTIQAVGASVTDTHPAGWASDHAAVSAWFRVY